MIEFKERFIAWLEREYPEVKLGNFQIMLLDNYCESLKISVGLATGKTFLFEKIKQFEEEENG